MSGRHQDTEEKEMDRSTPRLLLQTLIDYFEAGNPETDAAARAILDSDFGNRAHWEATVGRLRHGPGWTGLRAPEAEVVARALRALQQMLEERPEKS